MQSEFGRCPCYRCQWTPLLPTGLHDKENVDCVKLFCPSCKEVYSTLVQDIDICKKCGEKLQVRADDNVQSIEKRLEVFEKETKPILACFEKMNKLLTFVGDMAPEENLKRVQDTLAKLEGK